MVWDKLKAKVKVVYDKALSLKAEIVVMSGKIRELVSAIKDLLSMHGEIADWIRDKIDAVRQKLK